MQIETHLLRPYRQTEAGFTEKSIIAPRPVLSRDLSSEVDFGIERVKDVFAPDFSSYNNLPQGRQSLCLMA